MGGRNARNQREKGKTDSTFFFLFQKVQFFFKFSLNTSQKKNNDNEKRCRHGRLAPEKKITTKPLRRYQTKELGKTR